MIRPHPSSTLFPYTTLFRSSSSKCAAAASASTGSSTCCVANPLRYDRSEEHTSELQSSDHLVCRLLLEKKNRNDANNTTKEVRLWFARQFSGTMSGSATART